MWTRINVLLRSRNCSEAFPVWTQALSVIQFATLPFDFKRSFTKTRFRCNFCSDKSVQTWFGPFQKPIRYRTFHFQQRSGAVQYVLFRSRKCFESSVPSVNRSPIWYTFCDAPFHYPVQCEHSLNLKKAEKWSFKSKIWKPKISSFVIKKPQLLIDLTYFSKVKFTTNVRSCSKNSVYSLRIAYLWKRNWWRLNISFLTFLGGQNVWQNGNFCSYFENSRKGPIFKASNES